MKNILKILLILAILVQTTFAINMVAVLEIVPTGEDVRLTIAEFRFLTDELRTQARKALPKDYSILTRENILQLLPSDEAEAECLIDTGCAVSIGRAIGAEYVTQSRIGNFDGMLMLTVELYESMSGNMLSSFVADSENIRGLLQAIREQSAPLFEKLAPKEQPKEVAKEQPKEEPKDTLSEKLVVNSEELKVETIQSPVPGPQSQKRSTPWIALGLEALGAVALGIGVYQNFTADKHYKDYKKSGKSKAEYDSIYEDVKSAKTARDILYVTGSVLLISGITVHIWF